MFLLSRNEFVPYRIEIPKQPPKTLEESKKEWREFDQKRKEMRDVAASGR